MSQVILSPSDPDKITQGTAASPPGIGSGVANLEPCPSPIQGDDVILLYRNNLPYLLTISNLQAYLGVTIPPSAPTYMPSNYINNSYLGRYL